MSGHGIHDLERSSFPVLNESFLVDSAYEYVKELGQGQSNSFSLPPSQLVPFESSPASSGSARSR